jgi:predicted phage terminase large subunit-like protein
MKDWSDIYEFLQPKDPLFCPETPSLTQKTFLRSHHLEGLFGGAAGGGKSSALLMAALQYVDIPAYSAILFRRTYADLALPGALMDRFLSWVKEYDEIRWNGSTYVATFPSGARITFGYLNNQNDYLRYKSSEFQFIGMDEVTEIREFDYRYLFSRLRKPNSGELSKVPLRMRAASNPAPNWVRQRFIEEGDNSPDRIFVPSFLDDNPGIDPISYRRALQEIDPIERARLEKGDWWAVSSGSLFDRENFIIMEPTDLPDFVDAQWCRFWDLAATEPSHVNPDPDWTVGVLGAFDQGVFYLIDVQRVRVNGADVEKLVARTAELDGPHVAVRMEQEPGSSGKSLIDLYARYILPGIDFIGIRSTGDKVTRAKPLSAAVANGNVRLVRGPYISDFLDEVATFPESAWHDDQVDAASSCFNEVAGLGHRMRGRVSIII